MNELKPCPFCGRKMKFYKSEYINKYGNKVVEQYYMHEGTDSDCILDKICMPFVIGAGDADPETGRIGEYAEAWNRRADVVEVVRCRDCKYYKQSDLLAPNKFCFRLVRKGEHIGFNFSDDDFCSYGERKDGGENAIHSTR